MVFAPNEDIQSNNDKKSIKIKRNLLALCVCVSILYTQNYFHIHHRIVLKQFFWLVVVFFLFVVWLPWRIFLFFSSSGKATIITIIIIREKIMHTIGNHNKLLSSSSTTQNWKPRKEKIFFWRRVQKKRENIIIIIEEEKKNHSKIEKAEYISWVLRFFHFLKIKYVWIWIPFVFQGKKVAKQKSIIFISEKHFSVLRIVENIPTIKWWWWWTPPTTTLYICCLLPRCFLTPSFPPKYTNRDLLPKKNVFFSCLCLTFIWS